LPPGDNPIAVIIIIIIIIIYFAERGKRENICGQSAQRIFRRIGIYDYLRVCKTEMGREKI